MYTSKKEWAHLNFALKEKPVGLLLIYTNKW